MWLAVAGLTAIAPVLVGCGQSGARDVGDVPTTIASSSAAPTQQPSEQSEEPDRPSESGQAESTDTASSGDNDVSSSGGGDENPPPAASEAQTLCNLTYEYVWALYVNGTSAEGEYLDIAALSLSDSLRIWRGLVGAYPEAASDVERAQSVYDAWQRASVVLAEGDTDEYERLLAGSEADIKQLPSVGSATEVECT